MGVEIDIVYEGKLHCAATHGPSRKALTTDAPVDNGGKGESFSPTDLVATALGTCLVTIMGLVAERNVLDIAGTRVHVLKEMAQQPLRRIAALSVTISVPAEKAKRLSAQDRQKLENASHMCPVHASLHPEICTSIKFAYEQ